MALSSSRSVTPGDGNVASAAYRAATGTRGSAHQRVDESGGAFGVATRHEWRPAEDHGTEGGGAFGGDGRRRLFKSELDFTPLVLRYASAYIANEPPPGSEPGALVRVFFADVLRGVQVYEGNLRILAARDPHGYVRRGYQVNRLF